MACDATHDGVLVLELIIAQLLLFTFHTSSWHGMVQSATQVMLPLQYHDLCSLNIRLFAALSSVLVLHTIILIIIILILILKYPHPIKLPTTFDNVHRKDLANLWCPSQTPLVLQHVGKVTSFVRLLAQQN